MVPEPPEAWDFSVISGMWGTLDYFLPVSEALVLLGMYLVFYGGVMAYRLIKRHIPGVA